MNAYEVEGAGGAGGTTVVLDTVALLEGVDLGANMDVGAACEWCPAAPMGRRGSRRRVDRGAAACEQDLRMVGGPYCASFATPGRRLHPTAALPPDYEQEQGRGTLTRLVIDVEVSCAAGRLEGVPEHSAGHCQLRRGCTVRLGTTRPAQSLLASGPAGEAAPGRCAHARAP